MQKMRKIWKTQGFGEIFLESIICRDQGSTDQPVGPLNWYILNQLQTLIER